MLHGRRWVMLRLFHGKYHDKFRWIKLDEAQLVLKRDSNLYMNVSFSQMVTLLEINANVKYCG